MDPTRKLLCAALAAMVASFASGLTGIEDLTPQESWAGRKRHPAVVHSVTAVDDGSILSLSGAWKFEITDGAWVRGDFDKRSAEVHVEVEGLPPGGCSTPISSRRANRTGRGGCGRLGSTSFRTRPRAGRCWTISSPT